MAKRNKDIIKKNIDDFIYKNGATIKPTRR